MSDQAETVYLGNGRYALNRLLGVGGAGSVYLAYDTSLARWVAIKRMPQGDAKAQREVKALANFLHPNIVALHDIIEEGGEILFVMELVIGQTIEELAEPFTEEAFRSFASQCLEGFGAAHEQNIVHRDIKPANIMLAPLIAGGYRVKILDFGQSRMMTEPSMQTIEHGAVFGSIYMMSPEQLSHQPLDHRTDFYSLGCVFYQSLTLQRPFTGGNIAQIITAHLQHRFEPLKNIRPDLPEALTVWVESLFAFDREQRPATARAALENLQAIQSVIRVNKPLTAAAVVPVAVLKQTQMLELPKVADLPGYQIPVGQGPAASPDLAPSRVAQPPIHAERYTPAEIAPEAEVPAEVAGHEETPAESSSAPVYFPPPAEPLHKPPPQNAIQKLWKRVSESRFFFISVVVHVVFVLIAGIFVVQSITAKRKLTFTSSPPSPNPSQRALEHKVQMAKKQNTMSAPAQAKRITTTGLAKVSLPDMPSISASTDFSPGKMAGMGGTGVGIGFKGGVATSGGKGALGGPISFFGMRGKSDNVLKATFYDLKQSKSKKPLNKMTNDGAFCQEVLKFVKDNNWNKSYLSNYYQGSAQLFAPRLYIPMDKSGEAPKAFGVEKDVNPFFWLIHYKGRFKATQKGTFRFVGCGDNVLFVRFNRQNVLDGSGATVVLDPSCNSNPPELLGPACAPGWQLKAGKWFQVNQGQSYDIEILVGDAGGGLFSAYLFYEEKGVTYPKRSYGSGLIYPLFELENSPMPPILKPSPLNPPFLDKAPQIFQGIKAGL